MSRMSIFRGAPVLLYTMYYSMGQNRVSFIWKSFFGGFTIQCKDYVKRFNDVWRERERERKRLEMRLLLINVVYT